MGKGVIVGGKATTPAAAWSNAVDFVVGSQNGVRELNEVWSTSNPTGSRPGVAYNESALGLPVGTDVGLQKTDFLRCRNITLGYTFNSGRRELYYDIDKGNHPEWKITGTENISISGIRGNYFGGGFGRVDSSIVRPANLPNVIRAEQLWKFVSLHDYVIGDFMWTGIDYLGEARWPSKNSGSGVIDLCGFPKDAYYFYQSQWTTKPMIHLAPHWNWKGKEGQVMQVMAYTNCDTVELFLNGRSFGMKAMEFPRQGNAGSWNSYDHPPVGTTSADLHLIWDVPYEPGVLKAVGRKGGKLATEEEIHTSGAPAAFRLSVDRDTIDADKRDVAHVKIEVVDENGYVVPDANEPVQIIIEGAGRLIGLDNGNPFDHTSMKSNSRNTFNGLALAVIQSEDKTGVIRVRTNLSSLKNDAVEVFVKKTAIPIRNDYK